ncbi:Similar to Diphthamide biosynthesis protein 4; acc. no. Q4WPF7 [Pyronema omphalodes CBS 100304]|uniref:Diphthamide biosynthesis protein 4 n=1 Tax=Pyronema omphalodes (strain CBS 100304) TaxID=1076935 RepID=U4LWC8_PYROM|nr:Similar to Diphthamide biosynthesis protein 4; acc. no. Q4WPF7 [Pyronema omphalodes CBS 100304]
MQATTDYYTLLHLPHPPSPLSPQFLKKAYHSALLRYHPDKTASQASHSSNTSHDLSTSTSPTDAPSIDTISLAYRTLSDPGLKKEYDAARAAELQGGKTGNGSEVIGVVDLDDFVCHDGEDEVRWTKACRCGEEEGFVLTEKELGEAAGEGEKEVLVGCVGCSLWWRVGFEVVDEES